MFWDQILLQDLRTNRSLLDLALLWEFQKMRWKKAKRTNARERTKRRMTSSLKMQQGTAFPNNLITLR